jgi:hypothetical protein
MKKIISKNYVFEIEKVSNEKSCTYLVSVNHAVYHHKALHVKAFTLARAHQAVIDAMTATCQFDYQQAYNS